MNIVLQTVKDVLDSLVCDNLVESDKIGAGNFFWSLPSKQFQTVIKNNDCMLRVNSWITKSRNIMKISRSYMNNMIILKMILLMN